MNNLTSLFLSQSYQDTWEDYNRSLTSENFPKWDYIILTASNENQAEGYRSQIESRKDFLPAETHFAVIPDEGNVRVGSGGATLSVLRYIYKREEELKGKGSFEGLSILVIHSGGDSKRVPSYLLLENFSARYLINCRMAGLLHCLMSLSLQCLQYLPESGKVCCFFQEMFYCYLILCRLIFPEEGLQPFHSKRMLKQVRIMAYFLTVVMEM